MVDRDPSVRTALDGFPGLAAPAAFAARLALAGRAGALVLIDLDGASSELVAAVTAALQARVRSLPSGGRAFAITREELAVVLDDVAPDDVLELAYLLLDAVESVGGRISGCGAVPLRTDGAGRADVRRTVRDAGLALRAARRAGTRAVSGAPETVAALTLTEEEDLEVRTLFRSGAFELHYQPLVDPSVGRPVGLEALVRARDTAGALVSPGDFLPQARRSGVIVDLGTAVLIEALAAWRAGLRSELMVAGTGGPVLLTVNLDGEQVEQDGFDGLVLQVLERSGVPAEELVLEVTESVLTDAAARGRLQRLRDVGVKVAIDDFGAGPIVLSEIRELPVDILKVDQVLVGRLDPVDPDMSLIEDLELLARLLGLRLAVEAVESAPLAERVATLGVALAQGYHYARPLPPGEVVAWLRSGMVPGAATPGDTGDWRRGTGRGEPV